MNKLKYITLIVLIVFTLTACKQQNDDSVSSSSSNNSSSDIASSSSQEVSSNEASSVIESSSKFESSSSKPLSSSSSPTSSNNVSSQVSSAPPVPKTVRVTIKEGTALTQIAEILEKNKVVSKETFFKALETIDLSSYPFMQASAQVKNRCFALEGYLYPDTYEFYINDDAENVIYKMLNNFNRKISAFEKQIAQKGSTVDEIITLASVIQKESGKNSELPNISSILYNRLAIKMKLQCDVTINYIEWYVKPYISGDINRFNSYYNTYKCAGLPAGPICNPSIKSIQAALNPSQTDYLYFVTDKNANYYYATTFEQHQANCDLAGVKVPSKE